MRTASHPHYAQLGDLISSVKEENSAIIHLVHVSGLRHYPYTSASASSGSYLLEAISFSSSNPTATHQLLLQ